MPNLLRNVLAVLAGIAIGGGVNMALITLGPSLGKFHDSRPCLVHRT